VTVRVAAASRLHFGLVRVPGPGEPPGRRYGGLGLMVDRPGVTVTAEPAAAWTFAGSLAARAESFRERLGPPTPYTVTADGPPEHVGLGVGTALGLAVAAALTAGDGVPRSPEALAILTSRGGRSGVGVHGFGHGGLIVDRGKPSGAVTSECQSVPFPPAWRVVLIRPAVAPAWFGSAEFRAFSRIQSAEGSVERLERLRDGAILPAVARGDFGTFAESLYEYNRLAGAPFAADQGGTYAGPTVTATVGRLRSWGVTGVGQSSWGPTVFAFAESEREAGELVERLRGNDFDGADVVVAAAAGPATVTVS
jgi:beta-ribofuranosylaminobenzene 5'-phosphate synthase